jgi:hypothetical protein
MPQTRTSSCHEDNEVEQHTCQEISERKQQQQPELVLRIRLRFIDQRQGIARAAAEKTSINKHIKLNN